MRGAGLEWRRSKRQTGCQGEGGVGGAMALGLGWGWGWDNG